MSDWTSAAHVFVGREHEMHLRDGLVDRIADRGTARNYRMARPASASPLCSPMRACDAAASEWLQSPHA